MSKNILVALFFVTIMAGSLEAQQQEKLNSLNNYINFSNEGTHGLLIVHRLLENFNKNINKYVDLPDQQMNFYSNKDLPQDIFQDDENWFYDTSPNEYYTIITKSSGVLPSASENKLKTIASDMKTIMSNINKLRFDLEKMISTLDLSKRENLSLVYDKLEEGVKFYKSYYDKQMILEKEISSAYLSLNIKPDSSVNASVTTALKDVYGTTYTALKAMYNKEDEQYPDLIKGQESAIAKLNGINLSTLKNTKLLHPKLQLYWANIKKQTTESIKAQKAFAESENIPEEYKLYGKHYFFYNISVINKFNRYGNGVVFEINRIYELLNLPVLKHFELPHYFKVVYPKLLAKTDYLASADPVIKSIPKVVKGRNVVSANRTINVDKDVVEFQLYDHKIIDKDIVSLSFNGEWIIEKFEISEKPKTFILKLNSQGKNFLLLHADDMGRQPPATIALSYTFKGKKELIILNSDTVKSEVIEIVLHK